MADTTDDARRLQVKSMRIAESVAWAKFRQIWDAILCREGPDELYVTHPRSELIGRRFATEAEAWDAIFAKGHDRPMAETTDIDDTAEYPGPAEARTDAERLDWLERSGAAIEPVVSTTDDRWRVILDPWNGRGWHHAPTLRKAIDKAMAEGE